VDLNTADTVTEHASTCAAVLHDEMTVVLEHGSPGGTSCAGVGVSSGPNMDTDVDWSQPFVGDIHRIADRDGATWRWSWSTEIGKGIVRSVDLEVTDRSRGFEDQEPKETVNHYGGFFDEEFDLWLAYHEVKQVE
jgi:transcriptional regulator of nitric oxide reductase